MRHRHRRAARRDDLFGLRQPLYAGPVLKVLQAALDNLLRRQMLPSGARLSLGFADAYVAALSLPPEQLVPWAAERAKERGGTLGYSMRHLSSVVMGVGVGATSLKKREQQEVVGALQDLCAQHPRD